MLQKYNIIIMIKCFIYDGNLNFGAKLMSEERIVKTKKEFCFYA